LLSLFKLIRITDITVNTCVQFVLYMYGMESLWRDSFENKKLNMYLVSCSADYQCSREYVNCGGSSPTQTCIHQGHLCYILGSGISSCGNDWDSDPEMCGEFTY